MEQYKIALSEDKELAIGVEASQLFLDGSPASIDLVKTGKDEWNVIKNNKSYTVQLQAFDAKTKELTLSINGKIYNTKVKDQLDMLLKQMGMSKAGNAVMQDVKAPMPGLVLSIDVAPGDEVAAGDALLILEAMKMENVIKATGSGVVKSVLVKNQDAVEKNQVLIEME